MWWKKPKFILWRSTLMLGVSKFISTLMMTEIICFMCIAIFRRDKSDKFEYNLAVLYVFAQYLDHFCGVALIWWYTNDPKSLFISHNRIMRYYSDAAGQETVAFFMFVLIYLHQTSEVWMLSKETALQLLVIAGTYASCVAWSFYKAWGSINSAHGLVGDHQELLLLDSIVHVELQPSLFSIDNSIIVYLVSCTEYPKGAI